MNVGAVDIGTNSMRLLIVDTDGREVVRDSEVTGLGTGVDAEGVFDAARVRATLEVMDRFAAALTQNGATVRVAVATSATRDAHNGGEFVDEVAVRLGVTPEVISGEREARLAFAGATRAGTVGPCTVVDIGGGSTEFVAGDTLPRVAVSVDIGSVRLTDRLLPDRPAKRTQLDAARAHVDELFSGVIVDPGLRVIGVAGTFTSIAAISLDLDEYDRSVVDGSTVSTGDIRAIVEHLSGLTVEQTAAVPSLQPKRAPVILAGAVIALGALTHLGAESVTVSESDLLDALAAEALRAAMGRDPESS